MGLHDLMTSLVFLKLFLPWSGKCRVGHAWPDWRLSSQAWRNHPDEPDITPYQISYIRKIKMSGSYIISDIATKTYHSLWYTRSTFGQISLTEHQHGLYFLFSRINRIMKYPACMQIAVYKQPLYLFDDALYTEYNGTSFVESNGIYRWKVTCYFPMMVAYTDCSPP